MARTKVYGKKKGNEFATVVTLDRVPEKVEQRSPSKARNTQDTVKFSRGNQKAPTCIIENSPTLDDPTEALARLTIDCKPPKRTCRPSKPSLPEETLRQVRPLLRYSGDKQPTEFSEWLQKWLNVCNITKIGDGTFSDVYSLKSKANPSDSVVGKLIPLRLQSGRGKTSMKLTPVHQALAEVKMMEALADVEGFAEFRSSTVLRGCIPNGLKEISKAWDDERRSIGKIPEDETAKTYNYPFDQLWLFLEMDHAGRELEVLIEEGFEGDEEDEWRKRGPKPLKIQDVRDILYQVTRALATAEKTRRFEHRDLHISNVCVKRLTKERKIEGQGIFNRPTNLQVSIIDFTISRADIDNETVCQELPVMEEGEYQDIQLQTYVDQERATNAGSIPHDSAAFLPMTNVFWIHYLLTKLLAVTKLRRGASREERDLRDSMLALKCHTNPALIFDGEGDILTAIELLSYLEHGREEYLRLARAEADLERNNPEFFDPQSEAMRWVKSMRLERWREGG